MKIFGGSISAASSLWFFLFWHSASQILAVLGALNSELSFLHPVRPTLCLESNSLCHSLKITPRQKVRVSMEISLVCSPSLKDHSFSLTVVQWLITIASCILSSSIVIYDRQINTAILLWREPEISPVLC